MQNERLAVVLLQCFATGWMGTVIHSVAAVHWFALITAWATAVIETVASATGASWFAKLSVATAAMANRLKMAQAAAADKRAAVKENKRYCCPNSGRPGLASDKPN
jgi:hypothetical protein